MLRNYPASCIDNTIVLYSCDSLYKSFSICFFISNFVMPDGSFQNISKIEISKIENISKIERFLIRVIFSNSFHSIIQF